MANISAQRSTAAQLHIIKGSNLLSKYQPIQQLSSHHFSSKASWTYQSAQQITPKINELPTSKRGKGRNIVVVTANKDKGFVLHHNEKCTEYHSQTIFYSKTLYKLI